MLRLTQAGAKLLPGRANHQRSRALITHCSRPERPDLRKLAEMAHISITDAEVSSVQVLRYCLQRSRHCYMCDTGPAWQVEEWEPKVQQVVDW